MSMIVHRCEKCQKPDYWRDGRYAAGKPLDGNPIPGGDKDARKCCAGAAWGPPELVPTFHRDTGHRVLSVTPPGGPAGAPGVKTCGCDECHEYYAEVKA